MAEKAKIKKWHEYWIVGGSRIIIEVLEVNDARYADGIRFTYRMLSPVGETVFAIENEHGTPHLHRGERKTDLDCNWKSGLRLFEEMASEYEKKMKAEYGIN